MRILVAALALLLAAPSIAHAGPIGPALAVAFAGATAASTTIAVTAAFLQLGASLALSALSRALGGKRAEQKPKYPGLASEFTAGEAQPMTVVFGRAAVRGHALSPAYSTDLDDSGLPNRFLFRPTVLSDLPITEIEGCYLEGTEITFTSTVSSRKGFLVSSGPYAGKMWLNADLGTQTAVNAIMFQNFSGEAHRPWTSDMIGRGKAILYPVFRIEKEDNPFQQGVEPEPLWVLKGAPLYDPRTGVTAFTENPVVMRWNILRGITIPGVGVWGLGVDEADLPASIWHAEMNVCDEVPPEVGGKRYRAGVEFGLNQEPMDILAELLKADGGDIADCGGTWLTRTGPPPASVYSFTDEDVIITDGREFRMFPGLSETFNAVSATSSDPRNAWEPTAAIPITNAEWEEEDGGRRLTAELTYPTVPYPEQVRRLMRETADDNRRFRSHILTLPPAAMHVMPLDTVTWTSVENGYDAKLFEVVEKVFDPIMLISRVFLRERDPSDYDWDAVSDADLPQPPSRVGQDMMIYGVDGFDAAGTSIPDADGVDRRPAVHCVWSLRDVDGIEIEVVLAITEQMAATKYVGQAEVNTGGTNIEAQTILPAQSYKARAKAVAAGRPSTWSAFTAPFSTPGTYIGEVDLAAEFTAKVNSALQEAEDAAADVNDALGRITNIEGETFVTTSVDSNGRTGLSIVKGDGTPLGAIQLNSPYVVAPGMLGASRLVVSDFSGNNVPDADMRDPDAWWYHSTGWTLAPGDAFTRSSGEIRHSGATPVAALSLPFNVVAGETMSFSADARCVVVGNALGRVGVQCYNAAGAIVQTIGSAYYAITHTEFSFPTLPAWTVPSTATTARMVFWHDSGVAVGFNNPQARKKFSGATLITPGGIATPELAAGAVTALNVNTVDFAAAGLAIFGGELRSQSWPTSGFRLLQNGNAWFAGTVQGAEFISTSAIASSAVSTWQSTATNNATLTFGGVPAGSYAVVFGYGTYTLVGSSVSPAGASFSVYVNGGDVDTITLTPPTVLESENAISVQGTHSPIVVVALTAGTHQFRMLGSENGVFRRLVVMIMKK